jgi:hypothetical protein
MIAIQPNRPTSNAVSDMKSALAAAIRPSFGLAQTCPHQISQSGSV